MKIKEVRDKKSEHLRLELADKQRHLFDLRSQAVTEKLEDPTQLNKTRRDIARIKTVLRERELDEQRKQAPPQAEAASAETQAEAGAAQ